MNSMQAPKSADTAILSVRNFLELDCHFLSSSPLNETCARDNAALSFMLLVCILHVSRSISISEIFKLDELSDHISSFEVLVDSTDIPKSHT